MYDCLIIGSGLFGSVCARELTDVGYKCLVIDKRNHIGGNCYTENVDGINVHKYGPHIFHTSNKKIWNYVNSLVPFNDFRYTPKVKYKDSIYSFPINLMTLYQIYGVQTPTDARNKLEEVKLHCDNPKNLEEWILSHVGKEIYEIFIKGYTTKQWGRSPKDLPASIVKRLPIRLTFDDNYYFDKYQGIPIGGYTKIFEKLLENIDLRLNTDYFSNKEYFNSIAKKIIYTGPIDKFYEYRFGKLEYRSLRFETELLDIEDYQGVAGVNYTEESIPYTRIIEHKHFEFGKQSNTIITKEYPSTMGEPFYPVNDQVNNNRYAQYKQLMDAETKYIFGGRLTDYQYYDMHQVIGSALKKVKDEINQTGVMI
jgi:UDP-galactopyranose mutase